MNNTAKSLCIVHCAFCIAASTACSAATLYVSTNGLHDVNGVVWGTYETDDGVAHNAYTNLQQAINAAANSSTIWVEDGFTVSTGSSTYVGNATRVVCGTWNSKLIIRSRSGDWRTGAEIRGDSTTRCFGGQSDTFIGFRFVGGTTTITDATAQRSGHGGGAVIGVYGGTFENCLFADCTARLNGGAIGRFQASSDLVLRNCVFTNCVTRNGNGGAVASAKCYDCVFVGNTANGSGWDTGCGGGLSGGLAARCVFIDCHAYNKSQIDHASRMNGDGGGACASSSIIDCVFTNCTATSGGGALSRCVGGRNVTIVNCQAGRGGGGVRGGKWLGGSIVGCVDTNTSAPSGNYTAGNTYGGGASDGAVLTDFLISGNRAHFYGGGVNTCTLTNCVVVSNVASNGTAGSSSFIAGGGVYGGRAVNCVIANNIACGPVSKKGSAYFGSGGGAYGTALVKCLVTNNIAWYRGGGAYGSSAQNCLVADNESFAEGGGFAATASIFNTLIARNRATQQAGVWTDSGAKTVLVSSTVTANENTLANKSTVYRAAITNSVVWGNLGEGVVQTSTRQGAAYSCFPEADGANGTTSRDPGLADVQGKTFVATSSSCRRKGLLYDWMDNGTLRSTDWYGAPRVYQERPDMGWVSVLPPPRRSVIYVQ